MPSAKTALMAVCLTKFSALMKDHSKEASKGLRRGCHLSVPTSQPSAEMSTISKRNTGGGHEQRKLLSFKNFYCLRAVKAKSPKLKYCQCMPVAMSVKLFEGDEHTNDSRLRDICNCEQLREPSKKCATYP
uniref:Secreted protein n=1 Tax=Panagrellus redivivus TaxID=6233 RepID=A0A7E4V5Y7_PANRE